MNASLNISSDSGSLYMIELITINSSPSITYNNNTTLIKHADQSLNIDFIVTDEEANEIFYSAQLISENIDTIIDVYVQQNNSAYTVIIDSNYDLGGL